MEERFQTKKQKILSQLSAPGEEYTDASPKCSIDAGIRELLDEINGLPHLVTTSSCAGRISVFLEGDLKGPANYVSAREGGQLEDSQNAIRSSTSASGKGGGRWLFTSHDPVDLDALSELGSTLEAFGFARNVDMSFPTSDFRPQFIHFKFEPMILHMLAASIEQAQHTLNAAMSAGFRESGISGLTNSNGQSTPPMVAVRSSGLTLDTIIGFQDSSNRSGTQLIPMVSEQYLRTLLQEANNRFRTNEQRKERFRTALLGQAHKSSGPHQTDVDKFEPADVRRERKRREGLRRREQMLAEGRVSDSSKGPVEDHLDGADLGLKNIL